MKEGILGPKVEGVEVLILLDNETNAEYNVYLWNRREEIIEGVIITSAGFGEHPSTGEKIKRWGIVHRIDRETSGIVLIAKNQETYDFLKKQFLDREIEKAYHAIVYGDVRYDEGIINLPIGRNKSDFRKRATGKAVRGEEREAITHYKTLARKEKMSLVEANPQTGRTHQLRIHFADQGHSILKDKLYSVPRKSPVEIDRLALHAYAIEFELPEGKLIKIIAPYPPDFQKAVDFFKN